MAETETSLRDMEQVLRTWAENMAVIPGSPAARDRDDLLEAADELKRLRIANQLLEAEVQELRAQAVPHDEDGLYAGP